MPASHIIILILTCVLIALAVFAVHQINVRNARIDQLEDELFMQDVKLGNELNLVRSARERLHRRYKLMYAQANAAEERVLSRNIFDELTDEYSWLRFPPEPGASGHVYHAVTPVDAALYDAALNSHEVR